MSATCTPDTGIVDLTEIVGEFEIVCELEEAGEGCDNPAEWVLHRACCGSHSLGCDRCKERRLMNLIAVECPSCGTVHFDSASAYMSMERL